MAEQSPPRSLETPSLPGCEEEHENCGENRDGPLRQALPRRSLAAATVEQGVAAL